MKRLSAADAVQLTVETPGQHMHTIKVVVLAPPATDEGFSLERLRDHLAAQAVRLPPLRWRLVPVPMAFYHPFWADQASIDPRRHIRHTTAAAPGGPRQLCEVVARVASVPLDRAHPLWELWIVDGLTNGQVALVLKIHHALVDGQASIRLLTELLEGTTNTPPAKSDVAPSALLRLMASVEPALQLLTGVPALLLRTAKNARRRPAAQRVPPPFSSPVTPLNYWPTPNRTYACCTVALEEMRTLKKALGCTVTEAVLAAVAGALRAYLERRGQLPAEPLTAAVPVSLRPEGEIRDWGNCGSCFYMSLHTDVAEPVERMRRLQQTMRIARRQHLQGDPRLLEAWWDYGPLAVHSVLGLTVRLLTWLTQRPPYNVTVSSVRGPSRPLSCAGAPVVAIHSMGPLSNVLGLNVTAWSYQDSLSFGLVACPEHVPDLEELAERIMDEVAALRRAAALG